MSLLELRLEGINDGAAFTITDDLPVFGGKTMDLSKHPAKDAATLTLQLSRLASGELDTPVTALFRGLWPKRRAFSINLSRVLGILAPDRLPIGHISPVSPPPSAKIVGDVGHDDRLLGALDADAADHEVHPILLVREVMLDACSHFRPLGNRSSMVLWHRFILWLPSIDHPFGSIKQWMGQKVFLMRKLDNVRAEFSLTALAYNIRRVITLPVFPP